ncbi:MAG: hypothetical protein V8Q36_06275 [Anaerotignum sp.]
MCGCALSSAAVIVVAARVGTAAVAARVRIAAVAAGIGATAIAAGITAATAGVGATAGTTAVIAAAFFTDSLRNRMCHRNRSRSGAAWKERTDPRGKGTRSKSREGSTSPFVEMLQGSGTQLPKLCTSIFTVREQFDNGEQTQCDINGNGCAMEASPLS